MRRRAFQLAACYHEAGHALARLHIGLPATPTHVRADGAGESLGTLAHLSGDQYLAWSIALYALAGPMAEARYAKRSLASVLLSHGADDFAQLRSTLHWLVAHNFARDAPAAEQRAQDETRQFLSLRWPTIREIAAVLATHGTMSAPDLERLAISSCNARTGV